MVKKEIIFPYDLFGRNASLFVKEVNGIIQGSVYLSKSNRKINAKSLLGVLSLGVRQGEEILLETKDDLEMSLLLKIIGK